MLIGSAPIVGRTDLAPLLSRGTRGRRYAGVVVVVPRRACGVVPPASRALRVASRRPFRAALDPGASTTPCEGRIAGRPGPAPAWRGCRCGYLGGYLAGRL